MEFGGVLDALFEGSLLGETAATVRRQFGQGQQLYLEVGLGEGFDVTGTVFVDIEVQEVAEGYFGRLFGETLEFDAVVV